MMLHCSLSYGVEDLIFQWNAEWVQKIIVWCFYSSVVLTRLFSSRYGGSAMRLFNNTTDRIHLHNSQLEKLFHCLWSSLSRVRAHMNFPFRPRCLLTYPADPADPSKMIINHKQKTFLSLSTLCWSGEKINLIFSFLKWLCVLYF